jgi:hypothetical protein
LLCHESETRAIGYHPNHFSFFAGKNNPGRFSGGGKRCPVAFAFQAFHAHTPQQKSSAEDANPTKDRLFRRKIQAVVEYSALSSPRR